MTSCGKAVLCCKSDEPDPIIPDGSNCNIACVNLDPPFVFTTTFTANGGDWMLDVVYNGGPRVCDGGIVTLTATLKNIDSPTPGSTYFVDASDFTDTAIWVLQSSNPGSGTLAPGESVVFTGTWQYDANAVTSGDLGAGCGLGGFQIRGVVETDIDWETTIPAPIYGDPV